MRITARSKPNVVVTGDGSTDAMMGPLRGSSSSASLHNGIPHNQLQMNNNDPSSSTTTTTTTKVVTKQIITTTDEDKRLDEEVDIIGGAPVGKQNKTTKTFPLLNSSAIADRQQQVRDERTEGSEAITTIGCVGAQSGSSSRIVVALLKEGQEFQLKIQEMKPAMLEIGANSRQNNRLIVEQENFVRNLRKQDRGPLDGWMEKFRDKWSQEERDYFHHEDNNTNNSIRSENRRFKPRMQTNNINNSKTEIRKAKRRLTYMCMGENVATCWRALLNQLDKRSELLAATSRFYAAVDELIRILDTSEAHVQASKAIFLQSDNVADSNFKKIFEQLALDYEQVLHQYKVAYGNQVDLIRLIEQIANNQMGDSRKSLLVGDAQALIKYIKGYLEPLEKRKLYFESVVIELKEMEQRRRLAQIRNEEKVIVNTTTTRLMTNRHAPLPAQPHQQQQPQQHQPKLKPGGFNESIVSVNRFKLQDDAKLRAERESAALKTNINNDRQQQQPTSASSNNSMKKSTTITKSTTSSMTNNATELANNARANAALKIREINSLNDLISIEQWLELKLNQLNSSQLSSLGSNSTDSREVLSKHEQIMLECHIIDEATSKFQGKSIHGLSRQAANASSGGGEDADAPPFLDRQMALLSRVRDVISILEVRVVLLRRAIDFYLRSREATGDIIKMMRRLQVDNSLQTVHFVTNELELRDVSSVVASGATIISELQQLQLAQQQGQRPSIIHLNLETSGVRALIDELNHELAHLKSVLNQRRLVLQNEDSEKMASNFINKCQQLHVWLEQQLGSFLMANARLGSDPVQAAQFCLEHERMCAVLQQKASEVEALLRSMASLGHQPDNLGGPGSAVNATSGQHSSIQEAADHLRRDWIEASNCLARRIELAKRYSSIMKLSGVVSSELEALDRFSGRHSSASQRSGSGSADPRTEDELRKSVEQRLEDLESEVGQVVDVARPESIQISSIQQLDPKRPASQLNHEQVSEHVNAILARLKRAKREVEQRIENSRANLRSQGAYRTQQQQQASISPLTSHRSTNVQNDENNQQQPTSSSASVSPNKTNAKQQQPSKRPPRFTKELEDKSVEPFERVELECELDQPNCSVEWFMNNFKKIPITIRHSTSSDAENKRHKLVINNFSPVSCGTYTVRATNEAGRFAISQCKLKLIGIREQQQQQQQHQQQQFTQDRNQQQNYNQNQNNNISQTPASPGSLSTTSSFSQWRPGNSENATTSGGAQPLAAKQSIERIIRGVDEMEQNDKTTSRRISDDTTTTTIANNNQFNKNNYNSSLASSTTTTTTTTTTTNNISQQQNNNNNRTNTRGPKIVEPSHIDSPSVGDSSSLASRSISKSPAINSLAQPPAFVEPLRSNSRTGLAMVFKFY